jgi:hypothetical protein
MAKRKKTSPALPTPTETKTRGIDMRNHPQIEEIQALLEAKAKRSIPKGLISEPFPGVFEGIPVDGDNPGRVLVDQKVQITTADLARSEEEIGNYLMDSDFEQ